MCVCARACSGVCVCVCLCTACVQAGVLGVGCAVCVCAWWCGWWVISAHEAFSMHQWLQGVHMRGGCNAPEATAHSGASHPQRPRLRTLPQPPHGSTAASCSVPSPPPSPAVAARPYTAVAVATHLMWRRGGSCGSARPRAGDSPHARESERWAPPDGPAPPLPCLALASHR